MVASQGQSTRTIMTSSHSADAPILVVEDEALVALHLKQVLHDLGLHPHVFMEGTPALASIAACPYQAAVLDLGLPDMPGERVVAALLERNPSCRIVLATGLDVQEVDERFGAIPGVRVLSKPFDADMLQFELAALGVVAKPEPLPRRLPFRCFDEGFSDALLTA